MRKTLFVSPRIKTTEIDKSDKKSVWAKTILNNETSPFGSESPGSQGQGRQYILQENGFFLLQEDGSKIIV